MRVKSEFERLFSGDMSQEEGKAFLIELYKKGETVEDITSAVETMRKYSVKLPMPKELRDRAIDIVGTGGDKSFSFNISTTVSLLLASLGRVVANTAIEALPVNLGSADVLEALGVGT